MREIGKLKPVEITEELKKSFLDYAMSVIVARALPDVRDGLKPVHRRILYAMHTMGLGPSSHYSKSAKIVGETMGKFHPHGDVAIYDTLARLAQDFNMRYPLVDGQGNFGSIDGDSPAAMRYTEARMSAISQEILADIDKNTVDFIDTFDATNKEPVYLPSKIPNLLLMGSDGIAVGMATKIPPHNLRELVDVLTFMIEKGNVISQKQDEIKKIELNEENMASFALSAEFESETSIDELMNFLKGPDFPTGASIYNRKDILECYSTGRGRIIMQAKASIDEGKDGKFKIVVTEIPYQINKAKLVAKIAQLVREKKLEGISDLRDESDRHGLRIVIELKKASKPKSILNNLYKHTQLRSSYPVNMVALVDGVPQTLNIKQILVEFIRHRQKVVVRRTIFELDEANRRAHILAGLMIALENLDDVINTIRQSKDAEVAKTNLMKKFGLTEIQATAILEMQLRRLAALERKKIEDEYKEIGKKIEYLTNLLKFPKKILEVVTDELKKIKEKYGDERRTTIYKNALDEFSEEDLVPNEKCLVTVTKSGYLKRLPISTYRAQRRGGKGVSGMTTKESDEIMQLFSCGTHDHILFFTNRGRVFSTRAWDIPAGSRQSKGQAVINLINIEQDEKIQVAIPLTKENNEHKFLFMATKKGIVKKTDISKFDNIRNSGLAAIKIDKDDELCWVKPSAGNNEILLVAHNGKSIRFNEKDVRPMGRAARGVMGIRIGKGDYVVGMEIFSPKEKPPKDGRRKSFKDVLIIMEQGIGKRAPVSEYPLQKRGGIGVKAAHISEKTGKIISSQLVNENISQIVLTSKKAQVIKLPLKNIPRLGRDTQGVILMRFSKGQDSIAAVACLEK